MRISAIALDALMELVKGQMILKLGEESMSGINPSLSAICVVGELLADCCQFC